MGRATLVAFDIELGDEIVAALDRSGLKPNVALWAVLEEYGDARLILASRKLPQKSLREADGEVFAALRREGVNFPDLPNFQVYHMTDKLIRDLRASFSKIQSVRGLHIGNQMFGGSYLEVGYVYRID